MTIVISYNVTKALARSLKRYSATGRTIENFYGQFLEKLKKELVRWMRRNCTKDENA